LSNTNWPYDQSRPNQRVKPHGFWRDERTVSILNAYNQKAITESEATHILRVDEGDVRYYANEILRATNS
jgi:hypothetical protein